MALLHNGYQPLPELPACFTPPEILSLLVMGLARCLLLLLIMRACFRTERCQRYSKRKVLKWLKKLKKRKAISAKRRARYLRELALRIKRSVVAVRVRSLKCVLKDIEPLIKNTGMLYNGRDNNPLAMRPREMMGNWLMCVVANTINGNKQLTFSATPGGGDGTLINKKTGKTRETEHVLVTKFDSDEQSTEEKIIGMVDHKIAKGADYAKGKYLIVFSDTPGEWTPNRVARAITGKHNFVDVWVIGLESGSESAGYVYQVALMKTSTGNAPIWKVIISAGFDEWKVKRIQ